MDLASKLQEYRAKRNRSKTPEPFTGKDLDSKHLFFVIHKHKATALHYDLRLEVHGVMPSWAVPKGPSLDPDTKRLAMMTEDHPLDYRHFEGVIPEGQYGAGPVMIWDEGIYWPEREIDGKRVQIQDKKEGERVMAEGIARGKVEFFLDGQKLKGSFTLVKMKGGHLGDARRGNAWLLIKHRDEYCQEGYDANDYDVSARSGKSLKEIASNH